MADQAERRPVARGQAGAVRRLAELFALTGFAIAQPVLDVTGRSPDFFLFRRPSIWQIRFLVLLVILAPALGLWLAELVAGLFSNVAAKALHLAFLAGLFAVLGIEVGKHAHIGVGVALAVVAALAGIGLAVLAARTTGLRQAMLYATPAPLVFALLFVATSPAGSLVRASGKSQTSTIPPAAPEKRPPIVFIFLDEFPLRALLDANGEIDARLYPNFAKLASGTTWYPNATGVSGWTPFAAPAMLTGRYPQKAVAAHYLAYPQNLFTWLGGTYKVRAFETISELCPPTICNDVPSGRSTGLYAMAHDTAHIAKEIVSPYRSRQDPTQQFSENSTVNDKPVTDKTQLPNAMWRFAEAGKNQPERFVKFLEGLKPSSKPTLHFLHLLLPHAPWRYLPSDHAYLPVPTSYVPPRHPGEKQGTLSGDPVLAFLGKQRLLLQLAYTDHLLGTLLDRLKSTGLYDKSMLVVTADHGTGITPGARSRKMDDKNPADLNWVPLFVKTPGQQEAKVDRRNEQQVDLLPTIADVLDIDIPWKVDGQSMFGPARTTTDKLWYDTPGVTQHIPVGAFEARARTGLAEEVTTVKSGPEDLYAIGPYAGLVGKSVSALTVGGNARVRATMDKVPADALKNVDPKSGVVPAMWWGTFDGALGADSTWVVAAVNGTIAGTMPAVRDAKGGWRFVGIVNDKYLTAGHPDVRLYTVDGTTLHPVPWR